MAPKTLLFVPIVLVTLALDQASKWTIIDRYHYGEREPIISELLTFTHVRNPGGAFSFFATGDPTVRMTFFVGTTLVAIVLLIAFFRRLEPDARLSASALGLILGGALGNLLDRLVHGEVIDFLDVHLWAGYTWPTFNLADSFIVVGVAILMLEIFVQPAPEEVPYGESKAAAGHDAGKSVAAPTDP